MARVLLHGASGQALVVERSEEERLLVEAFGFITQVLIARARTQEEMLSILDDSRTKLCNGILALPGCRTLIEERFDVDVFSEAGEWRVRSKNAPMTRPPGPPR